MSDQESNESTSSDTVTLSGMARGADDERERDGYVRSRVRRILEKKAPEIERSARRNLLRDIGIDEGDESAAIEALREMVSARAKGEDAAKVAARELERLKRELAERDAALRAATERDERRAIREAIATAIGDVQIVPGALPQIQDLLAPSMRVMDGKVTVVVDGEPVDKPVSAMVRDWISKNKHFLAAPAPTGGAGSQVAGDKKSKDELRDRLRAAIVGRV